MLPSKRAANRRYPTQVDGRPSAVGNAESTTIRTACADAGAAASRLAFSAAGAQATALAQFAYACARAASRLVAWRPRLSSTR
jgi:hypothetical protein